MIIASAVKFHIKSTNTEVVIPCLRHSYAYQIMAAINFKPKQDYSVIEEGFIDNKNNFLTRHEAYQHALSCGQLSATVRSITTNTENCKLYSEDLW